MTADRSQLDLFEDSHTVRLANDVVAALVSRDLPAAKQAIARLRADDPAHAKIAPSERLVAALEDWSGSKLDTAADVDRVRGEFESVVAPTARAVLGIETDAFMARLWHELACAASGIAYDASKPDAHAAPLYLRAGDAGAADAAIDAIRDPHANPDALQWRAIARHRTHGLDVARATLLQLAWVAPQRFATVLAELGDPVLDRDWRAFQAQCDRFDAEYSDPAAWFPAWFLIEHPATRVDEALLDGAPMTVAADVFRQIVRLLDLEKRGQHRSLVRARERLRESDAALFAAYMARR